MAVSAFTVANIKPSLNIDSSQRFIFGLDGAPEPLGSFKLDNIFVPTVSAPSQTNFEHRNNTLSGFRWIHTTSSTDTFGSLKLQSFVNASPTGTDIWSFNQDGSITVTSPVTFIGDVTFSGGGGGGGSATWADLGTPTAPVDFGGQKLLNVGTGSTATDGVNLGQIQTLFTNLTLTSNKITDFNTAVAAFRLDQFTAPTTSLNLNNQKIITLADATDPQDGVNLRTLNAKISALTVTGAVTGTTNSSGVISTLLSATQPLGFTQLNFNWTNPASLGPGDNFPYVFQHLLSDNAPFYKAHSYVVKSAQVARYFSVDYNLGDPSTPSPNYSIKFYHPLATPTTSTPLSLISNPSGSAALWTMYLGGDLDLQSHKILNCVDPTTPQGVATKNFVESFVNAKTWTTSQITNFSSSVTAFRLDQFAAPTAALNINSQNLNSISSLGILTAAVGSGRITFSNAINSRKIALYDAVGTNDDYNYSGFGASATDTIYNCPVEGSHTFYTGSNINYAMQIRKTQLYLDSTSSTTDFRKVVLWQTVPGANNPHQVAAIGNSPKGINTIMRFQVPTTSSDFVFYSGIDSTSSYEAMRLTGTGRLGIGISPQAPLHFSYTSEPKIILYGSGDNTHQYFGFAIDPNAIRYQCFGGLSAHVFYSGTSATTSSELARITAAGELIVQGTIYGRRPSACIYMRTNATGTTVTANTWAKANGTTTSLVLNGFSMPTSNRVQNTTAYTIYASVTINALVSHSTGTTLIINIAAYKNGSAVTGSDTYDSVVTSGTGVLSTTFIVVLDPNDYLEAYVSSNGATTITPKSLTITVIAT